MEDIVKKIIALLCTVGLLTFSGCGQPSDNNDNAEPVVIQEEKVGTDGLMYKVMEKSGKQYAVITACALPMEKIIIPETLGDCPVRELEPYVFEANEVIKSITLPRGLEKIGSYAFSECVNLENIEIPESVTNICATAFNGTLWLEKQYEENPMLIINDILADGRTLSGEVVIPDGIKSIAGHAFSGNTELTAISIPETVTQIGEYAFMSCRALSAFDIPDSVQKIGEGAFQECFSLKSIIFPEGFKTIEKSLFLGCYALEEISIPESVDEIGFQPFILTKWLSDRQSESPLVSINGILIDGETASGDIVIPDNITNINHDAFQYNESITGVTIPNGVTSIGEDAFRGCSQLQTLALPNTLEKIGEGAFKDCPALTEFTIPDGIDIEIFSAAFGSFYTEYEITAYYKGKTYTYTDDKFVVTE